MEPAHAYAWKGDAPDTVPESRQQPAPKCDAWTREQLGSRAGEAYRLVRYLSGGAFGQVFVAEHVRLGTLQAVKLARPRNMIAAGMLAHEAKVLSRLAHPNIVQLEAHGQREDGVAYLRMEYARGVELESWLQHHGPMPAARAVGILRQLALALDAMHAQGYVHADLKPTHLIIDEAADDRVKLLDFGCAFDRTDAVHSRGVPGTPGYMAPEQACGDQCGSAVDIYGMAALASELLTGKLPHGHSTAAALRAVLSEPPALPSARGLLRPGLDAVFARALHRQPPARFASAGQFVAALERVFTRELAAARSGERRARA